MECGILGESKKFMRLTGYGIKSMWPIIGQIWLAFTAKIVLLNFVVKG